MVKVLAALPKDPESNQQRGLIGVQELCDSKKRQNNKETYEVITGMTEGHRLSSPWYTAVQHGLCLRKMSDWGR